MNQKTHPHTKFLWCPVCMVHTYHKKTRGEWKCLNTDHPIFLRLRDDPWIDEYRAAKTSPRVAVENV
ncbi:MAG: hypothetical protein WBB69_15105 [Anaerolineales bacterium]